MKSLAKQLARLNGKAWKQVASAIYATADGTMVPMTGAIHPDYPGLLIHYSYDEIYFDIGELTITHIASGHAVVNTVPAHSLRHWLSDAMQFLQDAGDWRMSGAEIQADRETKRKMQDAIETVYALLGRPMKVNRRKGVAKAARAA